MTTTDDILALARNAASAAGAADADADIARFDEAVIRGMTSDVVRVLRTLRETPATARAALPDSPAWRAWLSATAAIAGASPAADDPTACFIVCAAASALGHDCGAAVAAGLQATALVEGGLTSASGWSVPTVSAVIGAGLAAGVMLRLPESQLRHVLGICATQAAGLSSAVGTDAGAMQAGKAAFNAVEAAQFASLGFTSSAEPLDGRRGLFALFT
jgi:2-methylcitrate dehydratase PrpD